jgi:branched-chain amino acid transport system substrate-binding protein
MKIGLLLPRSVLYPSIAFDLHDGFKAYLHKAGMQADYQIVSANIGVAAKHEDIYAKCEQMLLDGVDIVVGYINPMAAVFIHPLFESAGRMLLVLDSGYHFPSFMGKLDRAYFITLQGNLCCRAITRKATQQGHKNFAFTCSFYDAGYRVPYSYSMSVLEQEGRIVFNHVSTLKKSEFTLDPLAEYLENNEEVALLTTFCGDMTEDFFREGQRHGLFAKHSLYGPGFMADESWLSKIPHPGNDWYSAVAWSLNLESPENREFVTTMEAVRPQKANLFSLLGWEAAQVITGTQNLSTQVADSFSYTSPRGDIRINPETRFTEAPVYYATVTKDENTGNSCLTDITKADGVEQDRLLMDKNIETMLEETANSWLNAYACLDS